jgi:hypothetical protein
MSATAKAARPLGSSKLTHAGAEITKDQVKAGTRYLFEIQEPEDVPDYSKIIEGEFRTSDYPSGYAGVVGVRGDGPIWWITTGSEWFVRESSILGVWEVA